MVLTRPGALPSSARLLVRLELLSGAAPLEERRSRLVPSLRERSARGRAGPRERTVAPGQSALVELRLSSAGGGDSGRPLRRAPALSGRDDRRRRRARSAAPGAAAEGSRAEALSALEPLESPELAERLIALGRAGARARRLGRRPGAARRRRCRRRPRGPRAGRSPGAALHALRRSPDRYVCARPRWRDSRAGRAETAAGADLPRAALGRASRAARFCSGSLPGADPRWAEAVEAALVARGVVAVAGEEARPPGRDELAGPERELSERIVELFRQAGSNPPSPVEVAQAVQPPRQGGRRPDRLSREEGRRSCGCPAAGSSRRQRSTTSSHRLRASGVKSLDVARVQGDVRPDPAPRDSAARAPRRREGDASRGRPARGAS